MKKLIAFALIACSGIAMAQKPADPVEREISGLFIALEQSGCEFSRNGTWYDAKRANSHLQRKYAYLLKKDLVTSTESFIELAASRSSVTGKSYLVRCGHTPPVESKIWFAKKLEAIRGSPPANNGR